LTVEQQSIPALAIASAVSSKLKEKFYMIRTVSDFLEEFKIKGLELIKKHEIIDHPVLIGDMYEGLTQELLNKAIFEGLNLKIVSGKVKNSKGDLSGQIDCMIVEGEGEKLPFSHNKYIYHFSQVIAVVEVKKSLYSNSLHDAYSLLKTVIDVSKEPERDGENYLIRALRDSWKSLLRMELPRRNELDSYSEDEQYIYHTLLMEAYYPIRIVIGYFGFNSEYSLREAFVRYLEEQAKNGPAKGFGPGSFPSIIICGNNSIIKNNGMPYSTPFLNEEYYWPIYVTSSKNPVYHLLEIIWTRLSYKFKISPSVFGADFENEIFNMFINCKLVNDNNGNHGWMYNYISLSKKNLNESGSVSTKWSPLFLTKKQTDVILILIENEFINFIDDSEFIHFIIEDGTDLHNFLDDLVNTGLVYKRNNEIRLLTDECKAIVLPDGRYCVGEDKNGQFTKWIEDFMK
jgi:hypothetical protein